MSAEPRIATVSLNAAIDQTALVPGFTAGEVNRVEREQSDAGGKGVNVASFLAHFGHQVAVTGLLGLDNAGPFDRLFAETGIADRFVRIPGRTRVNVKVVAEERNAFTDINFPGLSADRQQVESVCSVVDTLAAEGVEWFVLSGSLPGGVPLDIYRRLVEGLRARGRHVVLDTSGNPLAAAIAAGPNIVKPNIDEFRDLTGRMPTTEGEIVEAARALMGNTIDLLAVSMGAQGAIFVTGREAVLAAPPAVAVKSTVGAGDAMVAGIVHGSLQGLATADLARVATAFSSAAVGEIGPRLPPRSAIEAFVPQVAIKPVGP